VAKLRQVTICDFIVYSCGCYRRAKPDGSSSMHRRRQRVLQLRSISAGKTAGVHEGTPHATFREMQDGCCRRTNAAHAAI
jgi:hypothetical protein